MTDRAEDPLIEEALRWFVVLRDESHDENDRRAFERRRATDAAHETARQRARAAWAQADVLEPAYGASKRHRRHAVPRRRTAAPQAGTATTAASGGRHRDCRRRRRTWPTGRTCGPTIGRRQASDAPWLLADGSTVELAGGSALSVSFGTDYRQLRLVAGEPFFAVAADAARPFIVEAGEGRTRALGTAFDVKLSGEVGDRHGDGASGSRSRPAPTARSSSGRASRCVTSRATCRCRIRADMRVADAWRRDRLVFQDASLRRGRRRPRTQFAAAASC